jgi:NAD(P)-dependent dehydrogenase (short-subunit alcohol dehydrogenase family)
MDEKKIAVVTGAVRGIGRAITERLVADGYFVLALDLDSAEPENFRASLPAGSVEFVKADIREEKEVIAVFEKLRRNWKRLDVLVNNAGIIRDNLIWKMPSEDFDAVLSVNLKGTWLMCREAARIMKEQCHGRIVNVASRAWLGNRGQSNYAASKAGVVSLTRVLALELGKYNVLVNAVAPGLIDTPLTQKLEPDVLNMLIGAQPTKSMGKAEDVANAVSFLANERTSFITGQTLYVDGGKSIGAGL